jgi:hypothetical protein
MTTWSSGAGAQSLFTVGSAHDRRTGVSDQHIYIDDIASSDGFGTGALAGSSAATTGRAGGACGFKFTLSGADAEAGRNLLHAGVALPQGVADSLLGCGVSLGPAELCALSDRARKAGSGSAPLGTADWPPDGAAWGWGRLRIQPDTARRDCPNNRSAISRAGVHTLVLVAILKLAEKSSRPSQEADRDAHVESPCSKRLVSRACVRGIGRSLRHHGPRGTGQVHVASAEWAPVL